MRKQPISAYGDNEHQWRIQNDATFNSGVEQPHPGKHPWVSRLLGRFRWTISLALHNDNCVLLEDKQKLHGNMEKHMRSEVPYRLKPCWALELPKTYSSEIKNITYASSVSKCSNCYHIVGYPRSSPVLMFVNISHPHEIPMKAVNQGRTCIHSLTRSISLCSQGIGLAVLTKVKTYDQHNNEMASRVYLIKINKQ